MQRVGIWVGLCLGLVACGGDSEENCRGDQCGTAGSGGTAANGANPNDPFSNGGGAGSFGNPNAPVNPAGPIMQDPNMTTTEVDSSFIWIANSSEGTVSKINTRDMTEVGRYRTSPSGSGLPSRTSVAVDGDVAVANRGMASNAPGGDGGGVVKIYATKSKCVDANGNGAIDTSTGAADVKAWGEDECIAWYTVIPEASNRPVAWAPPPAPDAAAKVWTAGATTCSGPACNITVYRLDGTTGTIEDTIPIALPPGVGFIPGVTDFVIGNYGPYGGASDAGGNFWVFNGNTTHLVRIDATTLEVFHWEIPMANGYGITIDTKGRVFVCGAGGLTRFDPMAGTFTNNNPPGKLGYNGCMTDGLGGVTPGATDTIWVGGGSDGGEAGLHAFDADTLALITSHPIGPVKGVSVDIDGFVWGVSAGGVVSAGDASTAYRLDAATGDVQTYDGLVGAYSYSDMTGFGLASAGYQPPKPPE